MTPGTYNLDLYRGDTYRWQVRLWVDAAASVPVDLTGATVAAQFRDKTGGTVVVDLGAMVTVPNTIDVTMLPAMWADAPPGGVWDLQVTEADGDVLTVLAGTVKVTADVTVVTP